MRKTTWFIVAALLVATPAVAGGNRRAQRLRDYDGWYFNGKDWMMETTSWLGSDSDDASDVNNYSNGVPVTGDDLLFPEDAIRKMGSNMDAFVGVKSTGTLTLAGNAVAAETVTIGKSTGSKTYTWVAAMGGCSANDVLVGATASDSIDNLIAAITGGAGSGTTYCATTVTHTQVTAVAGAGDTMDVTSLYYGTTGNTLDTLEAMTNGSWGAADLAGGTDFQFNLIFIGGGNAFDIGDSANPLYASATKLVHQGSGQLFYKQLESGSSPDIVINSDNLVSAANLSGGDAPLPWTQSLLANLLMSRGGIVVADSLDITEIWMAYRANPTFDVSCEHGSGKVTTLFSFGGTFSSQMTPSSLFIFGGEATVRGVVEAGQAGIRMSGGRLVYSSNSDIATLTLAGGTIDMTQRTNKITISALRKIPDPFATLLKSDDLVTITAILDFTGGDTP